MKSAVAYVTIFPEQAGQRLDNFLLRHLKPLPRAHLYRLIRKGEVRINKKRCKPDQRVQTGDLLRLPPIAQTPPTQTTPLTLDPTLAKELTARILYESKQLLIINKPSGMAVHGGSGIKLGVIEALRLLYPHEKYLELAHRLDRDTSGCLILTKKPAALRIINQLLHDGDIDKRYLLLVKGRWPSGLTKVEQPLYKNHLQNGERVVQVNAQGKPSLTHFKLQQRYAQTTLVEARPKTGRTHQIRVHTTWAGCPIVGDDKYGDKVFNRAMRGQGVKRLFLHAASLMFVLDAQTIRVAAPLDEALTVCLNQLPR